MKIKKKCMFCRKEYFVSPCRKNTSLYCSFSCRVRGKASNKKQSICLYCGKLFTHNKQVKRLYCSQICANSATQDKRGKSVRKVDFICKECGKSFCLNASHVKVRLKTCQIKYCSRDCYIKSIAIDIKKCKQCGKSFLPQESRRRFCSRQCVAIHRKSVSVPLVMRQRISETLKRKSPRGEKSPLWKGGKTKENAVGRNSFEYKEWRNKVFRKNYWTCQKCGHRGKNIEAHHINPYSPGLPSNLDPNNGITLCKVCHFNQHRLKKKQVEALYPIKIEEV